MKLKIHTELNCSLHLFYRKLHKTGMFLNLSTLKYGWLGLILLWIVLNILQVNKHKNFLLDLSRNERETRTRQ